MNSPQFEALFLQNVAASFDKQNMLAEFLGEHNWSLDTTSGELTFNTSHGTYTFPSQILGSESEQVGTWLWIWANDGIQPLPSVIRASEQLRALGRQQNIPEFTQPEIELNETLNGHVLSMTACGYFNGAFYYRGPYEGGAAFLLVDDPAFLKMITPAQPLGPLFRAAMWFPRLIMNVSISNHREAFKAYLRYLGLTITEDAQQVTGRDQRGDAVFATFNSANLLTNLETTLKPNP